MRPLITLHTAIITLCLLALNQNATAQNKTLAIVPVEIISNEPTILSGSMENRVTADFTRYFEKNSRKILVQDTRTTNSILYKNNITAANLAGMAPNELAAMLGVDYVVFGSVDIENQGATTTINHSTSYDEKSKTNKTENNKNARSSGNVVSTTTSSTSIRYQTRINIDIYDAKGFKVYTQSRVPVRKDSDAYLTGLNYMTKRTPFGKKKR